VSGSAAHGSAPHHRSALHRNAGAIALVTGGFLAVTDIALLALMDPDDLIAQMLDPVFRVVNAAYFVGFVGLAIGLVAVHAAIADRTGRFGLVAFLAALTGTMFQGGNMWFDGFAAPWLAEVAPQVFTAERTAIVQVGALSSYLLFALGWVLFGIAALRSRVAPILIGLALVVGGVLGFGSGIPPYGAPIGLAVAALGCWLIHTDRAARRVEVRTAG
jgi:hypothetical protein